MSFVNKNALGAKRTREMENMQAEIEKTKAQMEFIAIMSDIEMDDEEAEMTNGMEDEDYEQDGEDDQEVL